METWKKQFLDLVVLDHAVVQQSARCPFLKLEVFRLSLSIDVLGGGYRDTVDSLSCPHYSLHSQIH